MPHAASSSTVAPGYGPLSARRRTRSTTKERDRRDRGTVSPDQGEPHRGTRCSRSTSSRTSQPQPGPPGTTSSPSANSGTRGRELLAPGDVVDVDLEQPHVRDRRAPLGRDERREVAVVVVRSAGDLVRLGERRDLQRLREAVPDHVDGGDVHRAGLEVRPEAAQRVEVLAGAERDRRAAPRVGERRRRRTSRPRARRGRTARARGRRGRSPPS